MSGASSVNFYRSPVISCSMSGRKSAFTKCQVSNAAHLFFRTSLVGSTIISTTYSINVRPCNDPYIKIAEEAMGAVAELLIPGSFLVDIIPILKHVPEWFPGTTFHSKAAMMRKHAERIRNKTFSATEELMVCDSPPFLKFTR